MIKVFNFTQEELKDEGEKQKTSVAEVSPSNSGAATTVNRSLNALTLVPKFDRIDDDIDGTVTQPEIEIPKPDGYDSLWETLSGIDDKYSTVYKEPTYNQPQSLNLEKLEYEGMTEDEILLAAQNALLEKQLNALAKIESSSQNGMASIQSKIDSLLKDAQGKEKSIAEAAAEAKKKAGNNAVNRGLARSSILTEHLHELDKNKSGLLSEVNSAKDSALGEYRSQILQLQADKSAALSNYELVAAADLQAKIDNLMSQVQNEIDSVTKYNNTVDEKEAKYQVTLEAEMRKAQEAEQKRVNDQIKLRSEYGAEAVERQILEEKLSVASQYFLSLDPATAYSAFKADSSLQAHLKDYYGYLESVLRARMKK